MTEPTREREREREREEKEREREEKDANYNPLQVGLTAVHMHDDGYL